MHYNDPTYGLQYFEEILIGLILLIAISGFLFFFFAFYKRLKRLKENRKKIDYEKIIDSCLFAYLFEDKSHQDILENDEFRKNLKSDFFKRLAIKAIISLHQSYSGVYRKKLENFYAESGLAKYSLNRLNASYWVHIVEGIGDLSGLHYHEAYPRIVSYKNHENEMVRIEVLLGMINLKGVAEIIKFKTSELFLNDWVQSNILYLVKNQHIPAPDNFEELLSSDNKSVVGMAVRLINYYQMPEHYDILAGFYQKTGDKKLKKEIALALKKTEQLS